MSYREILYTTAERVATITLNRPEKLNAWTPVMAGEVREAMERAAKDDEVRAIVLTGAGRGFCAGADMGILDARTTGAAAPPPAALTSERADDNLGQRYSYLLAIPKPVIAGINGPVAGVGLVLALYCDLRYMADGAKLTTAFARRGLIAEYGSAWMLPRLIGPMNALDLLLSARTIEAAEAARLGLARLLPAEGFRDAVQRAAAELAGLSSPRSMGVIKRQVHGAFFQSLAEASQLANAEMAKCWSTADFKEGVAHYLEKRPPRFTGR